LIEEQRKAPKHPKSALQELAAAKGLSNPEYEVTRRSGAHHSPHFSVRVSIPDLGSAEGEGASKQEAETAAAAALLESLTQK
jgi:ribonuclease-3